MDIVNEWIKKRQVVYHKNMKKRVVEKIICEDGFFFSVQASATHYCSPREDDSFPYSTLEVAYPSEVEVLIKEYAENRENLKGSVYGHVPLSLILKVIDKHGGIKV